MAKIPFGILGPFIGKVGPVIGYMRGDTWCVRSMPMHYRDARTAAQLVNRSKLTRLMQFLCSMKPVIRASFDVWNSDNPCRTEFNMAFAENFHRALRTTARGTEILYHKIMLADGLLPGLSGAEAYRDGNEVHVCWNVVPFAMTTFRAEAMPGDRLCLCAHNADTGESVWDFSAGRRGEGHAAFPIPDNWQSAPIHLWAWFSSPFTTSPSTYLGEFAKTAQKQEFPQPASRRPLLEGGRNSGGVSIAFPKGICPASASDRAKAVNKKRVGVCVRKHIPLSTLHSTICILQSLRISQRPRAPMNKNNQASKVLPTPCLLRPSSLSPTTPNLPPKPSPIPLSP